MNNLLKRALGLVYVVEHGEIIEIRGVKTASLAQDIIKLWSSKKVERYMFNSFDGKLISFERFFAPDVHYVLQQVHNYSGAQTSKSAIRKALKELEENTWLKSITAELPDIVHQERAHGLFKKTPMPHQVSFFEAFNHRVPRYGLNGYLLSAGAGTGKGGRLSSKIKVPGGWTLMGQLKLGDTVTAWDGTPSKVTGVYPLGEVPYYKFKFVDGRSTDVTEDHLWRVYNNRRRPHLQMKLATTLEIIEMLKQGDRVHIDLCHSEKGPDTELPVHPYLMGVILGDGGISNGAVSITKGDPQLFDYVEEVLSDDLKFSVIDHKTRNVTSKIPRYNSLIQKLRNMKLMGKTSDLKWIPEIYFSGSTEQRLELLRGLLDTDGTVDNKTATPSFSTTSKLLAKDIQRLVWSLGGIALICDKQTYYTYGGIKKAGKPSFVVSIRIKNPSQLFKLDRKKERTNDENQYAKGLKLGLVSVEYGGTELCQCISIDHPDHLYITDDFIVTHNTYTSLVLSEMLAASLVVMVVPKNAVYRVWQAHLKEEYAKPQDGWVIADGQPYKGQKFIISHYEALEKAKQVATSHSGLVMVILDESHNINSEDSLRTQTFVQMCLSLRHKYVLWASGTPIKAIGAESIPLIKTIDPLFTDDAQMRFRRIFGSDSSRALDILRNRMGMISFRVESSAVVTNPSTPHTQNIKIPNSHQYTLEAIRAEMGQFIQGRLKHYADNMKMYRRLYDECLAAFAERYVNTKERKVAFQSYNKYVAMISKGFDPKLHKDEARYCNNYEKNTIIPNLPDSMKKDFRSAKSVVKYPQLKVLGEALGGILGKKRVQCQIDMIPGTDFKGIIENAAKKTIIFSSYVPVVDAIAKHLRSEGFTPVVVHAQADGSLPENVGIFERREDANPLIATYQSLSTAVPLIMANTTIFTNVPFRDHELVQAKARTNRLGQDTPVAYYYTYLDTGKEPNISTRSKDILEWSKVQVAAILGQDYSGEIAPELLTSVEGMTELDSLAIEHFMELDDPRVNVINLELLEANASEIYLA